MTIKVKLPDGAIREYAKGTTVEEVAGSISSADSGKMQSPVNWTAKWSMYIRRLKTMLR